MRELAAVKLMSDCSKAAVRKHLQIHVAAQRQAVLLQALDGHPGTRATQLNAGQERICLVL